MRSFSKIPEELKSVFENENIFKSGVGIENDCSLIHKKYGVEVKRIVDIGKIHNSIYKQGLRGLERLAEELLDVDKLKINIDHHKWNNKILSKDQIQYLCGDAWASREILISLYNLYIYTYIYIY